MGILDHAVVIIGAGLGLGRSYALAASAAGASMVVNDIDSHRTQNVVAEIRSAGGTAQPHTGSVADRDEATAMVELCVESFGKIDALVNNAAVMHVGGVLETPRTSTTHSSSASRCR